MVDCLISVMMYTTSMSIDWTPLFKKYKAKWLALKEAWDKAQKKGFNSPILTSIPDKLITYIGHGDVISV